MGAPICPALAQHAERRQRSPTIGSRFAGIGWWRVWHALTGCEVPMVALNAEDVVYASTAGVDDWRIWYAASSEKGYSDRCC